MTLMNPRLHCFSPDPHSFTCTGGWHASNAIYRQVSQCMLPRVGELPFAHWAGNGMGVWCANVLFAGAPMLLSAAPMTASMVCTARALPFLWHLLCSLATTCISSPRNSYQSSEHVHSVVQLACCQMDRGFEVTERQTAAWLRHLV